MDETEEDVEAEGGYKLNKKGFRLEKEKKKNNKFFIIVCHIHDRRNLIYKYNSLIYRYSVYVRLKELKR